MKKENKLQQYGEEAKTETMPVFLSYHSKNISLSEQKSETSLLGSEDKNAQTCKKIQICTNIKGKSETKEDQA